MPGIAPVFVADNSKEQRFRTRSSSANLPPLRLGARMGKVMKKTYTKPVLAKNGKLITITALPPSSKTPM